MSQQGLRDIRLSKEELRTARRLTKRFGTSYFWATLLFPRAIRQATFVLYAFFRIPDEYVDSAISFEDAQGQLGAWRGAWQENAATNGSTLPTEEQMILAATRRVFSGATIPFAYADSFLKAMEQDLRVEQYATYKDLEDYMYGSAAVVGLMMTEVIGYTSPDALCYARALGEAMQLTNFLRDIGEDWDERGRVYIPQEDLARFGVIKEDIASKQVTPAFKELMQFEIGRARELYMQAEKGIALLHPSGRKAVRAALVLYRAILEEIEHNSYDVLSRRARTSAWRKVQLILPIFFTK